MSKRIEEVTLGSDIEYFLQDITTKEIVSAEGFVKGTKRRPFIFDTSSKFWATSLDNVAYEGNIPPIKTKAELQANIAKLRNYIDSTLPSHLRSVTLAAHEFDPKWLETDNARTFGCDATFCVWTRSQNESPMVDTNIRSTGAHIHASWKNMNLDTIEEWIKLMDLTLGLNSVLMEAPNRRRQLYGKAGEFRFYDTRAEYRVLSSEMVDTEEKIGFVYDNTQLAIDLVNEGRLIDLESPLANEIVAAINNSDRDEAYRILNEQNIPIFEVA